MQENNARTYMQKSILKIKLTKISLTGPYTFKNLFYNIKTLFRIIKKKKL